MLELVSTDIGQDGTLVIKIDGRELKFVKESDLGAVKASKDKAESELTKLQTSLATVNTNLADEHQKLLKAETALGQVQTLSSENATLKTNVADLTSKVTDLTKVSGEHATKLTERIRSHLTQSFKVDAAKIKDMPLADLERTESALQLTSPRNANYDSSGHGLNGNSGFAGKSPLALAQMAYEQKK